MKNSLYNTIVDFPNGRSIIYNALSDKFIVYPSTQLTVGEPLQAANPKLHKELIENGMLRDEEINEIEEVKGKIYAIDSDPSYFHLHINPTLACNFHCWYCYEDHSSTAYMQPDTIEAVKRFFSHKLTDDRLRAVRISFFGGEPMLHFDEVARPLIEFAEKECQKRNLSLAINFTTNAYLINSEIIKFLKDKNVGFQITLDGHRDNHNLVRTARGGSYDRIIENVRKLAEMNKQIILRVNYTVDKIEDVHSIVAELKTFPETALHNITLDLQQVWQDIKEEERREIRTTVETLIEDLREQGVSATAPLHCDFVNEPCYADRFNYVLINYDGMLYFCTARDFIRENSVGRLTPSGELEFNDGILDRRSQIKFSREVCHACNIAPICGGGCRQKSHELEHARECILGYNEEDKGKIVLRRFERLVDALKRNENNKKRTECLCESE